MAISREDYERDRFPRYGVCNPERVESAFWSQLIAGDHQNANRYGHNAFAGHWSRLNSDDSSRYRDATPGPRWRWRHRFGQSETRMPDGRTISIGGQVEDFYDPDFCIYNDLVVRHTNGAIEIFLYPKAVFPPTDHHTATLVGSSIYLIGGLGYVDLRRPGVTPVFRLDTRSYAIECATINGTDPGWIYDHIAEFDHNDQSITVSGGKLVGPGRTDIDTFDWQVTLDLTTMSWI